MRLRFYEHGLKQNSMHFHLATKLCWVILLLVSNSWNRTVVYRFIGSSVPQIIIRKTIDWSKLGLKLKADSG